MKDLSGYIFVRLRYVRLIVFSFFCTLIMKCSLFLRGIKFGTRIKFYGLPVLIRMIDSRIKIGNNCTFRSDLTSNLVGINRKCIITTLRKNAEITIGDNSGFSGTVIAAAGKITIGNNVLCGANTTITDYDWHGIAPDKRRSPEKAIPVEIGNNVWLGLNSIVLKGVKIGDNTVIGANSIVTKNIPENVIAAGNPCKVIKKITE
ncbi:MAG: acyltransferase [Candidatus Delongbacteria bacterium]|nr:acyltransferase [Candidatus Delongbacteria bacterium]